MIKLIVALIAFLLPAQLEARYNSGPVAVVAQDGSTIIKTEKVAYITGSYNQSTTRMFIQDMVRTASLIGPRLIVIDSVGGYVNFGEAIIKIIKLEQSAGVKVYCYVRREAASMAFNTLSVCDVRMGAPNARYMVHKVALGSIDCEAKRCTSKYLQSLSKELARDDEPFRVANASALGYSIEDYDLIADNDTVFTSQTLYDRHYLHHIGRLREQLTFR